MYHSTNLTKSLLIGFCLLFTGCSGPGALRTAFLTDGEQQGKLELYKNIVNPRNMILNKAVRLSDGNDIKNFAGPTFDELDRSIVISPDKNFIAYQRHGGFSITAVSDAGRAILGDRNVYFGLYAKPNHNLRLTMKWSPNSRYIAYSMNGYLHTAPIDGSDRRTVSTSEFSTSPNLYKTPFYFWHGNDRLFYLGSNTENSIVITSLYTVNRDGRNEVKLSATENVSTMILPVPGDEFWILYKSDVKKWGIKRYDLYTVRIDGGPRTLIDKDTGGGLIQLSGDRVIYLTTERRSVTDSLYDLYSARFDGTDKVRIDTNVLSFQVAPDQKQIAYAADRFGRQVPQLFIAQTDGTNIRSVNQRIETGGRLFQYTWSPDSKKLAFRAKIKHAQPTMLFSANATNGMVINHTFDIPQETDVEMFQWSSDSRDLFYRLHDPRNKPGYQPPGRSGLLNRFYYITPAFQAGGSNIVARIEGYHTFLWKWSPGHRYIAYVLTNDKFLYRKPSSESAVNPENILYVYDRVSGTSKQISPELMGVFLRHTDPNRVDLGNQLVWGPDSTRIAYRAFSHTSFKPDGNPGGIMLMSTNVESSVTDMLSTLMNNRWASVYDFEIINQDE